MLDQVRFLREWFDIISMAMNVRLNHELTLGDIRDYFAGSGELLDGRPYDSDSLDQSNGVIETLEIALPLFERFGLIKARQDRDRYTKNLRLQVPERVGRLSSRGQWMATRPSWQRSSFFFVMVIIDKAGSLFKRFRRAVAVFGVVLTLSKLVLEWGNIPAAMVAIGAGIVAILVTLFGRSGE